MRRPSFLRSRRLRPAMGGGLLVVMVAGATALAIVLQSPKDDESTICTMVGVPEGVFVALPLHAEERKLQAYEGRLARAALNLPWKQRERERQRFARRTARYVRSTLGLRRVSICVDGRCRDLPPASSLSLGTSAPLPHRRAETLDVSTIVIRRGQPPHLATGRLRVQGTEPNGPGCGTVWQAHGRVEGTRILDTAGA